MFDIQKSHQPRYPGAGLTLPQEETLAYSTVSVNPYAPQAHVVALLAWAVRIAEEHGILEVVAQSTARLSFLAAVQAAEAFLSQEGLSGLVREESAGPLRDHWPSTPEPSWFSPVHARRRKLSLLRLGKPRNMQRPQLPLERTRTLSPSASEATRCQFDGQRWTLRFAGTTVTQRNLKGWRYLAFLLQRPTEEVHVLDLLQLTDAQPENVRAGLTGASADQLAAQGLRAIRGLDERITLDAAARAAYRQRWVELQDEITEAERFNDPARAANVRTEMDFLATELATEYGYRAHSRTASEVAEKARKAVTNRIRAALAKIQDAHPVLWQHLFTSLKTGVYCSYQPAQPTQWVF